MQNLRKPQAKEIALGLQIHVRPYVLTDSILQELPHDMRAKPWHEDGGSFESSRLLTVCAVNGGPPAAQMADPHLQHRGGPRCNS